VTNQVFSEAEEKQPLSPVESGRERNSAVDVAESEVSDKSPWQFSGEDDEREVALEVPEIEAEQVWEPEVTEFGPSKEIRWPALLAGAGIAWLQRC